MPPPNNCPICNHEAMPNDRFCQNCGVDLALAMVMTEHAIFASRREAIVDVQVSPEVLVPRLGEHLVETGVLTEKQLQLALNYQREQAGKGNPILMGQALIFLGLIDEAALDKAITGQIIQLQDALRRSNAELENRVQERTRELQKALNRLTELNQLKANFIANISHELRTPLTHIKGYTELMLDNSLGATTAEQADALRVMERAIVRLEGLINDLIRFSENAQGEITLHPRPIPVANLVRSVVERFASRAVSEGKTLTISQLPITSLHVLGDLENISWVLSQLIDNALKFTLPGGKIAVSVSPGEHFITFAVTDTGIGIPEQKFNEVFEAFHQLDSSATRQQGGTGLGLALVKRILQAHQTDIAIQSVEGKGSHFTFKLPTTTQRLDAGE
jgi:two-component system phosphate regulon sensor histidine kinase PhoR